MLPSFLLRLLQGFFILSTILPLASAQEFSFNYSVLFLQSHGETYDVEGEKLTTLKNFYNLLGENGISAASLNSGEAAPEILADFRALVITYPQKNFTLEELGAIESFVAGGGSLIVLGGQACRGQVNPLLERFGISIQDKTLSQNGSFVFVLDSGNHEIFSFVEKYQQVYLPSLRAENGSQILAALPFLPANEGLIVTREYGSGKVIALADADFLNDRYLNGYDNAQLGLNIINYALGREISPMNKADYKKYFTVVIAIVAALLLWRKYAGR